jgi:hypothetical protein
MDVSLICRDFACAVRDCILRAVQGETFACSHARQSVGKRKPENPRCGERGYVSFLAVRSIVPPQRVLNSDHEFDVLR